MSDLDTLDRAAAAKGSAMAAEWPALQSVLVELRAALVEDLIAGKDCAGRDGEAELLAQIRGLDAIKTNILLRISSGVAARTMIDRRAE